MVIFDVERGQESSVLDFKFNGFQPGAIHTIISRNFNEVLTGSADGVVRHIDLRTKRFKVIDHHSNKVCSLALSPNQDLLATGSNQDKAEVLDLRMPEWSLATIKHKAAVMALQWKDNQHLFSGGGTADKTIRVWCLTNNREVFSIDTGNQVCNLHLMSENTLVSTHGFTDPEIAIWKIHDFSLSKFKVLQSQHKSRILYSAWNGSDLFTGSPDDGVLCHWRKEVLDPVPQRRHRSVPFATTLR